MRRAATVAARRLAHLGGFTTTHVRDHPARASLCAAQRAQSASQAPPRLNGFSQRVRAHLAKHPAVLTPTTTDAGAAEDDAWATDRLLGLLLDDSHRDTTVASESAALHPLLCVRVLQRLGYAVWSGSAGTAAAARKGWSVRHTYPAVSTRGGNARPGSLERITGAVLGPLLPLLGDGTPTGEAHSQVRPAVPVVVEWLMTLPTSDRVPLQRWLPWLVAVYAAQGAAASPCADGELRSTVVLPPLRAMLPSLICKLRDYLSAETGISAPTREASSAVCERCLAALLAQCGNAQALAEVLWWSGETPLLSLAGVRRTLQQARAAVPSKCDEGATDTEAHTAAREAHDAGAPPLPCLAVVVRDDDVFRRLLLRLTALQHGTSTNAAPTRNSSCTPALVVMEVPEALEARCASDVAGSDCDADPDMILRFIQPLHEYVQLLQEASAARPGAVLAPPVQLSFSGVLRVLQAVFSRLDALKQQSCCRGAAAGPQREPAHTSTAPDPSGDALTYTLLSQKARLHALKSLCETLLRHTRAVQAESTAAADVPTAVVSGVASTAWFVDVDVRQQEAVLRRLCGAARALVRVVMEERRRSLVEEGPEGSVLTASSVTAARQQQQRGATSHLATSGAATVATMTSSFDHTLRSLAFRVVEPALWRLGEVCRAAQVGVPVHVIPFHAWCAYLRLLSAAPSGLHPRGPLQSPHRGDVAAAAAVAERVEETYVPVMQAVAALWSCVGGEAGLRTAQQVLPHPGQQSISTLVEGIRLAALRCFWFDGLHSGGGVAPTAASSTPLSVTVPSPAEVMAYTEWVLQHAPNAFYSVWQRTTTASIGGTSASVAEETAAAQRLLRARLGLLSILLHVRVLNAQTLMRRDQQAVQHDGDSFTSASASAADATPPSSIRSVEAVPVCLGDVPSSVHSLLDCVALEQPGPVLGADGAEVPSQLCSPRDAWSLVLPSWVLEDEEVAARLTMPAAPPAGCSALWEIIEELQGLASATSTTASAAPISKAATASSGAPGEDMADRTASGQPLEWEWLGTPEALLAAMEQHSHATTTAAAAASRAALRPSPHACDDNLPRPLFLLPWTTLAASHEPWRVYDESGQSRRAALEWAAALRAWLGGESVEKSCECAAGAPHRLRPLVRLVPVAEELRFFAALQRHGHVQLHPSVRVCRVDVTREALDFAPVVCSAPATAAAAHGEPEGARSDGWYVEDRDYDGLD